MFLSYRINKWEEHYNLFVERSEVGPPLRNEPRELKRERHREKGGVGAREREVEKTK